MKMLADARSCLPGRRSRQMPGSSLSNTKDCAAEERPAVEHPTVEFEEHTSEDMMAVDLPQENGCEVPDASPLLTRMWANRAGRREREDEDLVPEPLDSSGSSDEEEEPGNGGALEVDELDLTSDDEEPPIHAEVPMAEQFNTDFQVRATRAGMLHLSLF